MNNTFGVGCGKAACRLGGIVGRLMKGKGTARRDFIKTLAVDEFKGKE